MVKFLAGLALAALLAPQTDAADAFREGIRLREAGDASGARESFLWAVQHSGPGTAERGDALTALTGVETDLGRYAEAVKHGREAAAVFEALGDPVRRSTALNRAGRAAAYGGDYRQAEETLTAALALSKEQGNLEGEAEQLANLGTVDFFRGRYADAARRYDEGLAVTAKAATMRWAARRRRLLLANQASLYQRLGRDQEALAIYQKLGESQDLSPGERGQVLSNLGVLYRRLGDPLKAMKTYDEARTLLAHDQQVDSELNVVKLRGIVLALDLGRLEEAERDFTESLQMATRVGNRREMLHARLYRGETSLRAGHTERARDDFNAGLVLARELKTPEEEWKALYGLARAEPSGGKRIELLTEAVTTIEGVRERVRLPSLLSEFLNDKREVYDALMAERLGTAPPETVFNLLERSHSRVWRDRLGLATSLELSDVQRSLPQGVLLLDYWNAPRGAAVIAVSRQRAASIRLDVGEAQIAALIDGLAAGPSSEWKARAAAVASQLLPPTDWFQGIDHIIVVPDGAVALVPFEVLPIDNHLLIERAALTYTPTAATLLREAPPDSGRRAPWRLELKAFADPTLATAGFDESEQSLTRLTASADEARDVASELAGRAVLHVGEQNRKAYLITGTQQAPILHLATHAFVDASALEQSRIVFSPAAGSKAGADYLFLREAYDLPFDGVELAVLSACDTARGRLIRGEGVQSFSRAFLASGARSTVTTLWRVADRPTADFMQIFYHQLQRGVSRDQALRLAKLRFLTSGSAVADPHFWAAFVLTGDGLRPVPRAISWTASILATAIVVLPLIFFITKRRSRRASSRVSART